jgi:hypothetical protein
LVAAEGLDPELLVAGAVLVPLDDRCPIVTGAIHHVHDFEAVQGLKNSYIWPRHLRTPVIGILGHFPWPEFSGEFVVPHGFLLVYGARKRITLGPVGLTRIVSPSRAGRHIP